jgi:hypothetical protein
MERTIDEYHTPTPVTLRQAVQHWIAQAQQKLDAHLLGSDDLDALAEIAAASEKIRQRLLYLHTEMPSPRSKVVAMYQVDPVAGGAELQLTHDPKFPYTTLHDAILDGWQVIQFPNQRDVSDDRQVNVQGYEFILQKLEVYHD